MTSCVEAAVSERLVSVALRTQPAREADCSVQLSLLRAQRSAGEACAGDGVGTEGLSLLLIISLTSWPSGPNC